MNDECARFRPVLAEHLMLGMPLPADLSRHVDRCPDCAREVSELGDVVRTLRRSDPVMCWAVAPVAGSRPSEQPSAGLGDRIRQDVAGTTAARPRRTRRIAGALAAAAVAAVMAVAVPVVMDQQAPAAAVALVREEPMVSHPWGTEVPVTLTGLEPQRTYHMMVVNADGLRAPGGSVRVATGEPVTTQMTTAMPKDTITALVVEDDRGRTVVNVPVEPLPTS